METPTTPTPKSQTAAVVVIIAVVIVIALLIIGFVKKNNANDMYTPDEMQGGTSSVSGDTSTEAIESELNATDTARLDAEYNSL